MSAISTKGRMHFMVFTETFDAQVMCRFLVRLAGHFEGQPLPVRRVGVRFDDLDAFTDAVRCCALQLPVRS
ncbi:hypothetical protein [Streptomyces sp. bgisy029]|uniref:hypothetical protein n=1 Tax=Streptomyces sp. bgisy029 TaxID=3413771 RepID=UPI003D73FB6A